MAKSIYVCGMEKKNKRRQFLFNADWYWDVIGVEQIILLQDDEYFMVQTGLLGVIVKFQEKYLLNEKFALNDLEEQTIDIWKNHLTKDMTWPCTEEKLHNMIVDLFLNQVLPEMLKNEKNYRGRKVKTIQDQINKLQQQIDNA
jgi:hypothetical protein